VAAVCANRRRGECDPSIQGERGDGIRRLETLPQGEGLGLGLVGGVGLQLLIPARVLAAMRRTRARRRRPRARALAGLVATDVEVGGLCRGGAEACGRDKGRAARGGVRLGRAVSPPRTLVLGARREGKKRGRG